MTANNPNVDLVSINSYIKLGQNMSICSQDIEQIFFLRKSRAITLVQMCQKMICNNPNIDLVNINA